MSKIKTISLILLFISLAACQTTESTNSVPTEQSLTGISANNETSSSTPTTLSQPTEKGEGTTLPEKTNIMALGDPNAPVTIIEYSDYQCPFCRRHHQQTIPLIKANFIDTGRVYYVFKDFPIASLHPFAYRMHEAARCAGEVMGREGYWQAHDLFFEQANVLTQSSEFATDNAIQDVLMQSSLPTEAIMTCLGSGQYTQAVQEDLREGQARGVTGTPAFFINGTPLSGAQPYTQFESAIVRAESGEAPIASQPTQVDTVPAVAPTPASIEPRTLTALGDPDAPVTIVEYSDYQCPFCRRHAQQVFPIIKSELIDTGRVYYVFKDFPIASIHPLAYRLHEAALCIANLNSVDAYWQVHDLFFEQAETFQVNTVTDMDEAIIQELDNLDLASEEFTACLSSNQFTSEVQTNVAEGNRLGVQGTPTFFVNGYPLNGARPIEHFQLAVEMAEEGRLAEAFTPRPAGPNDGKAQATAQAAQPLADIVIGDAPTKGNLDAPVVIVEYSDYQCPFCLRHFNNTIPLLQEYIDNGEVLYVFKDYPLLNIHPQAQKAHEAAWCAQELAGDEGYWQMHDLLFVQQQQWASASMATHTAVLKQIAGTMDLPQAEFDSCLDSDRYQDKVLTGVQEGRQLGITGTPTFFINGQRLVGAQPIGTFIQVIQPLLTTEE